MQHIAKDLILDASNGDIAAFENIYQIMSGFVYNVALKITQNTEDAKDATQEVFIKLHKNIKDFKFKSSLKTWVYRITANTAINAVKKRQKLQNRTVPFDGVVEHSLKSKETSITSSQDIDTMLNVLNADQRACIVLRSMQGLSYQEIADSLKINTNTVRSRIKRARESLMVCFGERGRVR